MNVCGRMFLFHIFLSIGNDDLSSVHISACVCSLLFYINDRKKQAYTGKRDAYNISAFWSTLFRIIIFLLYSTVNT
jgi:hypothetical protein